MTTTPPEESKASRWLVGVIAVGLALVILAPVALSSGHIYGWARSPMGLDLSIPFAVAAFTALDLAAVICVSMTVYSGLRGEGAGIFGILTWLFAAGSAWINYETASTTPSPLDGPFFAAMALAGPLLLESVLARVRRWFRQDEGTQLSARAKFGARWLVSPVETVQAWMASRRENIASPVESIAYVRERAALKGMGDIDAIRYAWSALGGFDEYSARLWLQARGRTVTQAAMDEAVGDRPRTPLTAPARPAIAAPVSGPDDEPDGIPVPDGDEYAADRATLDTLATKRDKIRHGFAVLGSYEDVPGVVAWLAARGVEVSRGDAYAVRKASQETIRTATLHAVQGGAQ